MYGCTSVNILSIHVIIWMYIIQCMDVFKTISYLSMYECISVNMLCKDIHVWVHPCFRRCMNVFQSIYYYYIWMFLSNMLLINVLMHFSQYVIHS